jgi:peptide/nickel transport system substrate-binding protein
MLTFGILPEHLWYNIPAQSANLAEYNIKPVGSGPFQFKSLTKDKSGNIKVYTLERNDDFYDEKPFLDKVIFKFYADFPSLLDALQNKNIEGIGFLPEEYRDSLEGKKIKEYLLDLPQYTAIFFNQKNSEPLKDVAVRKALAQSLDKNKLVEEVFGQDAEEIDSPILPGYIGYSSEIKKNSLDETAAKDLLDKAGYKFVDGLVRKKEDKVLKITLTMVDKPEYASIAEKVKIGWEALGVQVDLKPVSGAELQREIIRPRAFEALMVSTIVGFDPDPFPFWHSSQVDDPGLNLAQYANRNVDKLIEEARQTEDKEERAKKYIEFQNILTEDTPAIFLYSPRYAYFVGEEVRGIELSRISIPSDRFAGVQKWYKKTKREIK